MLLNTIMDSIHLNWGIKTFFKRQFNNFKWKIDNEIVLKVHRFLEGYIFKQVISHYGADYKWNDEKSQNIDKSKNNYGYGLFHYAMIRNQRPSRVLCVGSMYGYIPYMMAKACQDNNFGVVDFVDANYSLESTSNKKNHYFGQGFWNEKNLENHFSYLLDKKFINVHVMTTKEFSKRYPKYEFDYIHLDGDHSYKGAQTDLRLFWKRLKKEGFMCFHDIHLVADFMGLEFSYIKIWQELLKTKKFKFELSNHYSGLGFLQKL